MTQSATSTSSSSGAANSVTILSVDQNNNQITGYYTVLYLNGKQVANHYTPAFYTGLTAGATYVIEADSYASCTFNHWQDNGDTSYDKLFTAGGALTFTAVYSCTSSSASSFAPSGFNFAGLLINLIRPFLSAVNGIGVGFAISIFLTSFAIFAIRSQLLGAEFRRLASQIRLRIVRSH